jgi:hypothetical protein
MVVGARAICSLPLLVFCVHVLKVFFLPLAAEVNFLTNQIARFRRNDSESPYNPPSLEVTCTGEIVEAASC